MDNHVCEHVQETKTKHSDKRFHDGRAKVFSGSLLRVSCSVIGSSSSSKVLSGLYYYLLSASGFKKQKLNVDFMMKVIHRSSRVVVAGFLLRSACYLKMI